MAKELDATKFESYWYDPETGETLKISKVVDITDDTPKASKESPLLLIYTRDSRGRLVEIRNPYHDEKQFGGTIFFYIDHQLEEYMNVEPKNDVFGVYASRFGLTKVMLRDLILTHAFDA